MWDDISLKPEEGVPGVRITRLMQMPMCHFSSILIRGTFHIMHVKYAIVISGELYIMIFNPHPPFAIAALTSESFNSSSLACSIHGQQKAVLVNATRHLAFLYLASAYSRTFRFIIGSD